MFSVTTKRLNAQIKRNARRFLADFAFRLSKAELVSTFSALCKASGFLNAPRLSDSLPSDE